MLTFLITMQENLKTVIKELSEIYDKENQDTFLSLYLTESLDQKFLQRRKKACRSILKGRELANFNETIKNIEVFFKKNTHKNLAVFSSKKYNYNKFLPLSVKLENLLVVDSSPYIRPLARILDEWESYTLILLNTNSAKIFSISMGKVDDIKKISKDIINKHKKGGWSQARFNRLRKGAINSFFKDVVLLLEKISDEKIIISGPGTAKNKFIDMLPQNLRDKVIDIIDISIEDENKLIEQSLQLVSENEKKESIEAVKHLKSEILKDGLAVYGVEETLQAVKNGQVELLIIEKNYNLKGWICEHCQYVGEGAKRTCPYCGKKTSEVDVLEEILEFAERTDAEVEFTDSEEISDLGHIGGILRYK